MRLITLGCSGSFAGPASPASCYLVQVGADVSPDGREWNVVLDLGNGALGALQSVCDPRRIDAVGISHLHPDHFVDLAGLYVYLRYHPAGARQEPVSVWGPTGTAERVGAVYGLAATETMAAHLDVRTWSAGEPVRVGPLTITPRRVFHPVEAYGMRITGPSSVRRGHEAVLAYTGDTDACDAVVDLARDADLLLSEAAFEEGRDDGVDPGIHLTGARAGQVATEAGARHLVLTHLPAWNDPDRVRRQARRTYAGPLDMARTGTTFVL